MRELLSFYAFIIGLAVTIGIGENLAKATFGIAELAVTTHKKGPITFGKLNRIFIDEVKKPEPKMSPPTVGKHRLNH